MYFLVNCAFMNALPLCLPFGAEAASMMFSMSTITSGRACARRRCLPPFIGARAAGLSYHSAPGRTGSPPRP